MKIHQQQALDAHSEVKRFMSRACTGDVGAIRAQVAGGFDLNGSNQFGDTLLEYAISALEFYPEAPKYAVVEEMLRLGADPNGLSQDGSGPLFAAVLNMDSEMVRLLLDAGADPNVVRIRIDGSVESLYDLARSAYCYEIWKDHPSEEVVLAEREEEDAWLRHLARLAVKYDKKRPEHLQLLRERGALSLLELRSKTRAKARARAAPISHALKSM